MLGYWNLPEQNAQAFHVDAAGRRWYRTGDIVREEEPGLFIYLGRRDRMIKRRGFRVELGEIAAALNNHPDVVEAARSEEHTSELQSLMRSSYAVLCWTK